jgi:stage III sporulation protein SpoIIIAA
MTVKLYVRWRRGEIITEKELEKLIAERQLERREDKDCMAEDIDEYLDRYDCYEIFSFTEEEKKAIIEQVQKDSDEWVRNDVLEEYDEVYIEV